jgi:hypothetical protein
MDDARVVLLVADTYMAVLVVSLLLIWSFVPESMMR